MRQAAEFDVGRLEVALAPPLESPSAYSWTLEQIRDARNDQLRGVFRRPAQLAESMRTDDALFTAYENRLAPERSIGVAVEPGRNTATARRIADEAVDLFGAEGVGVEASTLSTINGTLANHGVAFGALTHTPRDDGSRVDLKLEAWPIEFVRWDPILGCFVTQVETSEMAAIEANASGLPRRIFEVPIVHGDGRWVVFSKHEIKPWTQEACILPGALVWARHAFAARDWAKGSTSHGNAKIIGMMPEGVGLQASDGNLTDEAQAFLELLQGLASIEAPAGIAPAGSRVEYIQNTSTAWQVWSELMQNAEKAAARIYLGTDGMLGSVGGAPGVDIATLFGVATTKVQGDLRTIERGLQSGVIEPWAAINFGDSALAPLRRYVMPDPDAEKDRENYAKRLEAFHAEIERRRKGGFAVTQADVDDLAHRFDVEAPQLAAEEPAAEPAEPNPAPASRPRAVA